MTQPPNAAGFTEADSSQDDISMDELAALGIDTGPAAMEPAPIDDEISADELASLEAMTGVKSAGPAPVPTAPPPPPRAVPPPVPLATPPTPAKKSGFVPLAPNTVDGSMADTGLSLLMDVPLRVSVELGRISMTLQEVLALGRGSIVELERLAGEPVDILVNDTVIGHGEVVVVDEYFGVKITELIEPKG